MERMVGDGSTSVKSRRSPICSNGIFPSLHFLSSYMNSGLPCVKLLLKLVGQYNNFLGLCIGWATNQWANSLIVEQKNGLILQQKVDSGGITILKF